jgi:hypothetical protein
MRKPKFETLLNDFNKRSSMNEFTNNANEIAPPSETAVELWATPKEPLTRE